MRRSAATALLALTSLLAGCHSHYIQTTITNTTADELNVVQVDYPSASFGVQHLAPGEAFHYRFKLLGSGKIKIGFLDAHKGEHSVTGPWLNEGEQGTLNIGLTQSSATFQQSLHP
jgi:ethanolamine utilization microcompartment shell protein EutS